MKNKIILISALLTLLSSCSEKADTNEDIKSINDYAGEYSVVAMEWNKYGERGIYTVDIDGDGGSCNDIVQETLKMTDNSKWKNSTLYINKDGKTATFRAYIPVLDYYDLTSGGLTLNDPPLLESDKFDHLDWPDDNRIGLKTLSGIQISDSWIHHIYLTLDHYLVYDHATSTLIDGYVKVILVKE